MGTPSLSISLVAYNNTDDLNRLLPSLLGAAQEAEILVVDAYGNAWQRLERYSPQVNTVQSQNFGYGGNHNVNLARATGDYFVVMNADMVIVQPNLFARLADFMDASPDVGIVTPKVLNPDGTIQYLNKRLPTVLDLLLRRLPMATRLPLFQARLRQYTMQDIGYDEPCDVPFVSGAFLFCRTQLLKTIGGFDGRFFPMYFEDVDLSRRVQATHRTVYYPEVAIIHYWKRAAHHHPQYTYYFIRNGVRYFNKWGYQFL